MQLWFLAIATLLAVSPILARAQLPVCNISPAPRNCRIGNQVCPQGCIRRANCPTATVTSIITATQVSTVTLTPSASTITVTASTSSTAPPACKTEVPYANLFAFPDNTCKNATNLILGVVPTRFDGLVSPPVKFSNLTFNTATNYSESSCASLSVTNGGARSVYFTVDGIPKSPSPSCTMNLYKDGVCGGDPDQRFVAEDANKCDAARNGQGPWKSVQFKCGYLRDLCTESERFLGTCNKY